MKKIVFIVGIFFASKGFANQVSADSSFHCSVSNGWTLSVDYFYDGHPQGSGGWSGIAQLNDWGKFPLSIKDDNATVSTGTSHGPDRLDWTELDFSIRGKYFKMRDSRALGDYSPWSEYTLNCK